MKRKLTQIAAAVLLMSIFTSCGVSQEAKEVQEMIDRIPDTYSSEIDEDIVNARAALDELEDKDKEFVNSDRLKQLEEAYQSHYQEKAAEINKKIASLEIDISQIDQSRNDFETIIQETEKIPYFANDRIKYHVILEKINNESSRVADIVADANDILVMESIFEKLQSISSAYSAVTKYSYSCDIVSDVQTLSDRFDTQNLADAAEALMSACMDACLDGDELYEFYILTAHLDMCNEVSVLTESMGDFYMPYLEDGGDFVDDCLEWKKIIQKRMGE